MNKLVGAPPWITPFFRLPKRETPSHPPLNPSQLGLTPSHPFDTPSSPTSYLPPPPFSPPSLAPEAISQPLYASTSPLLPIFQDSNDPSARRSTVSHLSERVNAAHCPEARQGGGGGALRAPAVLRKGSPRRQQTVRDQEDDVDEQEVPILEWQASIPTPFESRCCCSDEQPIIPRHHQYYHIISDNSTIPSNANGRPLKVQQKTQGEYEAQLDLLRKQHLAALGAWNGRTLDMREKKEYSKNRDRSKKSLQKATKQYKAFLEKTGRSPSEFEVRSESRYKDGLMKHAEDVLSRYS
ncbi:hypothetical protein JCM5350_002694 [Sporobolomyces pararoseus]